MQQSSTWAWRRSLCLRTGALQDVKFSGPAMNELRQFRLASLISLGHSPKCSNSPAKTRNLLQTILESIQLHLVPNCGCVGMLADFNRFLLRALAVTLELPIAAFQLFPTFSMRYSWNSMLDLCIRSPKR